jgi:hypothetical protein
MLLKLTLIKNIIFIGVISVTFDACVSQGTLFDREAILQKPYKRWTEDECRIVMKEYASTNIFDRSASLSIVAIPCTPKFLLAYNCLKWKKHLCSFEEFNENTDRQAHNCFGGSFDGGSGMFINGSGKYIRDMSHIDSLLIVIDIQNASDMNQLIESGLGALVASSAYQDLFPDVTEMEKKISFRAGNVVLSTPVYVRSRNATLLTSEEQCAAMFHIKGNFKQYIREHDHVNLYFSMGNHSVVIPVRFSI